MKITRKQLKKLILLELQEPTNPLGPDGERGMAKLFSKDTSDEDFLRMMIKNAEMNAKATIYGLELMASFHPVGRLISIAKLRSAVQTGSAGDIVAALIGFIPGWKKLSKSPAGNVIAKKVTQKLIKSGMNTLDAQKAGKNQDRLVQKALAIQKLELSKDPKYLATAKKLRKAMIDGAKKYELARRQSKKKPV